MSADYAIFDACYKGRRFKKPKGTVVWVAEELWNAHAWEPKYSPDYYVRVRNVKTGKTESVSYDHGFKNWIPLDPISPEDFKDKQERALDLAYGRPWYRSEEEEKRLYG